MFKYVFFYESTYFLKNYLMIFSRSMPRWTHFLLLRLFCYEIHFQALSWRTFLLTFLTFLCINLSMDIFQKTCLKWIFIFIVHGDEFWTEFFTFITSLVELVHFEGISTASSSSELFSAASKSKISLGKTVFWYLCLWKFRCCKMCRRFLIVSSGNKNSESSFSWAQNTLQIRQHTL